MQEKITKKEKCISEKKIQKCMEHREAINIPLPDGYAIQPKQH